MRKEEQEKNIASLQATTGQQQALLQSRKLEIVELNEKLGLGEDHTSRLESQLRQSFAREMTLRILSSGAH